MKKIFKSIIIVLLLVLAINIRVYGADALTYSEKEVLLSGEVVDGVSYKKVKAESTSDLETLPSVAKQVVCVGTITPGAARIVNWAVTNGGSGIKKATVTEMAKDYEEKHPEDRVIMAINGDYFGSTNNYFGTRNPLAIEGCVLLAAPATSSAKSLHSMALNEDLHLNEDGKPFILTDKGGLLPISTNYYIDVYDKLERFVEKTFVIDTVNKDIEGGKIGLVFDRALTSDFNIYNINCSVFYDMTSNMSVYSDKKPETYYVEGYVNKKLDVATKKNRAIVSDNAELNKLFESNRKIRVYKKLSGKFEGYSSVFGTPQPTLVDGNVLPTDQIFNYGDHRDIRRSRTALGFKEDGTMVAMVFDERVASSLTVREAAQGLKEEGCKWGFNLDGGGSSTFAVIQDGELKIINTPSDGAPRPCGNGLLVVIPKCNVSKSINQSYACNGKTLFSGKYTVESNGLFDSSYELKMLIDYQETNYDPTNFSIEFNSGEEHLIDLVYNKIGNTRASQYKYIYHEYINVESFDDKVAPTFNGITFEKTDNGFKGILNITDNDNVIYNLKLFVNNVETEIADNQIVIENAENKNYEVYVSYEYKIEAGDPVKVNTEKYYYEYNNGKVEEEPNEKTGCNAKGFIDAIISFMFMLFSAFAFILKRFNK